MLLLFTPIYLHMNAHYDMNRKKLAFTTNAYRAIKLIGGYVATYKGGVAVHISKKKAILIPYTEMEGERKRFSFLKTFRLKSLSLTTETGAEYLFQMALLQILFRVYFFLQGGQKEKLENNLWLTDGDVLRISANIVLRFNIYIILRNIIMFLKEKIKTLWQKKIKKSTT